MNKRKFTGRSRKRWQWVAGAIFWIFAIQMYVSILAAVPPKFEPPAPISASAPIEFAFLNHTQIMEDEDGNWAIWTNDTINIITEIGGPGVPWGGDQATFYFGEAGCPEWDQTQYTCTTGLHSWSRTLDDEWKLYNLSIPLWCRSRFTSLSIQPIYVSQGMVNATPRTPERVWFNASGEICILTWSLGNLTDFALQLDGAVLKRNDYSTKMNYPCTLVADVVFQSEWLRFPARVSAGAHYLDIWGSENESVYYTIILDTADTDLDLLTDSEEMMLGDTRLSPRWANPWGYISAETYSEPPIEELIENTDLPGSWVHESLTFYVPPGLGNLQQELTIETSNGKFANITIDGDSSIIGNITMFGYIGYGDNAIQVIPPDGSAITCATGDLYVPDWAFGGYLSVGEWHTVEYEVYRSSLDIPQLSLFIGDQQVVIIGSQSIGDSDYDSDGVPDSSELSDTASLTWRKDSLLQLTIPCDREAGEDVQLKLQVVRGASDPDPSQVLEWHAAEDASRQVRLTQAMIAYGPGSIAPSRGQVDYWDNLEELSKFLGNATHPWPVDTYNLIGKDANGSTTISALAGDCDPLPQGGADAFDYQMVLFPALPLLRVTRQKKYFTNCGTNAGGCPTSHRWKRTDDHFKRNLCPGGFISRNPDKEHDMNGSSLPYPPLLTDPAQLPDADRQYYRTVWGFDPVEDSNYLGEDWSRYQECMPLSQDPALHAAGVTICARVDWRGEEIHKRIVFQRGDREVAVECTHTIVYTGLAVQAWTLAADAFTNPSSLSAEDRAILVRSGGPVPLPPWEHFAALKSYVAAMAEAGVFFLLKSQINPSGQDLPMVPFGFNAEMQKQIIHAIRTAAPGAVEWAFKELASELIERVPPSWIIERWDPLELNRTYPLTEVFNDDPQRLLAWLLEWEKSARDLFLPWAIRQQLDPILKNNWQVLLNAWDAGTVTRWCRRSDVLDRLQDEWFEKPELLEKAQKIAPTIPWYQLSIEWQAHYEAENSATGRGRTLEIINITPDFPQAEVWPREPFCMFEFPRSFFYRECNINIPLRMKRVEKFLREAIKSYTHSDSEIREFMVKLIRAKLASLPEELNKSFEMDDTHLDEEIPREVTQVEEWVHSGNEERRHMACLSPVLPIQLQEKLTKHWDFATRLTVCVNPSVTPKILEIFTQDVQPSIKAVAQARLRRGGSTINPIMGEVLEPGEIIWLLASHPLTLFSFGVTTWGDGSKDYATWLSARIAQDEAIESSIGGYFYWAYAEGFFCEDLPENERGFSVSHLALQGLGVSACGHAPCIYLEKGTLGGGPDQLQLDYS